MDVWDTIVLAVAGYVAVVSLARLMQWRRRQIIDRLEREASEEKSRRRRPAASRRKAS